MYIRMNIAKVGLVPPDVNKRRYDATNRRAGAEQTRSAILAAAREQFVARGYAATTMSSIATQARVSPDTLYASVGKKPVLFRALIETALSGTDAVVPGERRDYAELMRRSDDIGEKLGIYAEAVTAIQGRLAPLFLVLREAATANPELGALWSEISARRARNMLALADDLATTGALRTDLSRAEIADVIWTMNSSEYYALFVFDRGWSPTRFAAWLRDAWSLLLIAPAPRRRVRL